MTCRNDTSLEAGPNTIFEIYRQKEVEIAYALHCHRRVWS